MIPDELLLFCENILFPTCICMDEKNNVIGKQGYDIY